MTFAYQVKALTLAYWNDAGMFPWWMDGGTQRLSRIIGWGRALDMMLTGRRLNAVEALAWGLVTEIVPDNHLYERAQQLAQLMTSYPQLSLRTDKQAALRGWVHSLEEALRIEAQLGMIHFHSAETLDDLQRYSERP